MDLQSEGSGAKEVWLKAKGRRERRGLPELSLLWDTTRPRMTDDS